MSSRRQNSSCDQCRRAKRKCGYLAGVPGTTDQACIYCACLGRECTFDFANARAQQKRKKLAEPSLEAQLSSRKRAKPEEPVPTQDSNAFTDTATAPLDLESELQEILTSGFEYPAAIDFGGFNDLGVDWTNSALETLVPPKDVPLSMTPPFLLVREKMSAGLWSGSPIHLLNSTVTSTIIGDYLDHLYKSMMNGIESRYLTYTCNRYAPGSKYCFGDEDKDEVEENSEEGASSLTSQPSDIPIGANQVPVLTSESLRTLHKFDSPRRSQKETRKVTFVGIAHFLDHFGRLYGNKLGRNTKKEDEDILIATQQAFALQWAEADDTSVKSFPIDPALGSQRARRESFTTKHDAVFTAAWFDARSRIMNATSHRSFTLVYSTFLFLTTNPPKEARGHDEELNDILSKCLHQFLALKGLVEDYCGHLSPASTYRMLLESSVKIFHWFGYVRDTLASMVSNKPCILDDAPITLDSQTPIISPLTMSWKSTPLDDTKVPIICRQAVSDLLSMFRQFIHLRGALEKPELIIDTSVVANLVDAAMITLKEYDSMYGQFYEQCRNEFCRLSDPAKKSSAFLILFWDYGVLSLMEQIQIASALGFLSPNSDVLSKTYQYQKTALASAVAMSREIVSQPASCNMKISSESDIKLPLISHHANLLPIVDLLVKSIENTIQLNTSSEKYLEGVSITETESWIPSIKPLLSCLLDLDKTVAGTNTARVALHKLMNSYSDILMDCWAL